VLQTETGFERALLQTWCDALLRLQAPEGEWPSLSGGIWCPACAHIHGRCGDAVYPLLTLARATGEQRYIDAAVRLQAWSDYLTFPDGSWLSDGVGVEWRGITVFGAIALGEALRHHGLLLEAPVRARWQERFRRSIDYLEQQLTMETGNINYPVSCAAAFAIAAEVLEAPRYLALARAFAHDSLAYFTPSLLLFGEGSPHTGYTPRGCRAVDLGYNVEESLPNLILYGHLTHDEEVLDIAASAMASHLEFMLPDGGWDNSWGSRNFKWTYWGSRTSDGCQLACTLLADRDPRFAEAAARNTRLLAACTHDGLLSGGPHYHAHGELPCVHHTFCHAKALAAALDYPCPELASPILLPRETAHGVRVFPEIATWLLATGPWRATVTAYDWEYLPEGHASGGTLSLLWHTPTGPLLTAGVTRYTSMAEVTNMQPHRDLVFQPLTMRVALDIAGVSYTTCNDFNANVIVQEEVDTILVTVESTLVNREHQPPGMGSIPVTASYSFTRDAVDITILTTGENTCFYLPIVSIAGEPVTINADGAVTIEKLLGHVHITASSHPMGNIDSAPRLFNHVPGHEAIPLCYRLLPGVPLQVRLTVG